MRSSVVLLLSKRTSSAERGLFEGGRIRVMRLCGGRGGKGGSRVRPSPFRQRQRAVHQSL